MLRLFLLTILHLIFYCNLLAQQHHKYKIDYQNTSLIVALEDFSKKYKVNFGYDEELISKIKLSVNYETEKLDEAIEKLLIGTELKVQKLRDIYLIEPKKRKKENNIILSGYVKDIETGNMLPYANIQADHEHFTVSSQNGHFKLELPFSDTIVLTCSYLGYKKLKTKLNSFEIEEIIELRLNKQSKLINEVIVKSSELKEDGLNSNSTGYTLNLSKLNHLPIVGETDVFYSLKYIPGINGTSEKSSGVEIRGCSSEQNLVLYDGITIYHLDHFFGTFSALNSEAVQSIKVLKSGYEAKYGGRAVGVIDIVGKSGNFKKTKFGAGLNMLSANFYFDSPITKNLSLLIAGRRSFTDIIKSPVYNSLSGNHINGASESVYSLGGELEQISNESVPEFYYYDFNAKLSWKPTKHDAISGNIYFGEDIYKVANQEEVAFYSYSAYNDTKWGNLGTSIDWDRQWSDDFYSQFNLSYSEFESNNFRYGEYIYKSKNIDSVKTFDKNSIFDYSVRFDNQTNVSRNIDLDFGLHWSNKKIVYKRINDNNLIINNINSANEISGYIQNRFKILSKIHFSSGLRINYYDLTNRLDIEPRLNLKYFIKNNLLIKGAFSIHNQYLNKVVARDYTANERDFWMFPDNENIPAVQSSHYIAGFVWNYKKIKIDIESYRMIFNGITGYQIPATELTFNPSSYYQGTGKSEGVDIFIQHTGDFYNTSVGYSYGKSTQKFNEIDNGTEFPSIYNQLHEIMLLQGINIKRWNIVTTFIYGSGKPYTKPFGTYTITLLDGSNIYESNTILKNNKRLPDYHRMDIALNYSFNLKKTMLEFGVSIINIYNRKNFRSINYNIKETFDNNEKRTLIVENKVKSLGFTPNFYLKIRI